MPLSMLSARTLVSGPSPWDRTGNPWYVLGHSLVGAMARGDQLSRRWRLIRLLDHPDGFTVDEAAGELGCTVRTIWRDLGVLQKANFPLYYTEPDGRRSATGSALRDAQRLQAEAPARHPSPPPDGRLGLFPYWNRHRRCAPVAPAGSATACIL